MFRGITVVLDLHLYYSVMVLTENLPHRPGINPCSYKDLIFGKNIKNMHWRKASSRKGSLKAGCSQRE